LQRADVLNCDVAMANDVAVLVQVLWCRIVVCCRIGEETSAEMLCLHLDVKRGVGRHLDAHFRVRDYSPHHVRHRRNFAHWYAIAGTRLNLHAVGEL
jgi:hypothetical protein